MPYPSDNKNEASNRHCVAFQRDGLYTVAEGEGRAHVITLRFSEFPSLLNSIPKFLYIWNYRQGLSTKILILIVFI